METKTLERETFGDEFALVTDSQEIEAVLSALPTHGDVADWGCLFVKATDGDYAEVWAMESAVPWLGGTLYRLYQREEGGRA
jgi:hypothetical protein